MGRGLWSVEVWAVRLDPSLDTKPETLRRTCFVDEFTEDIVDLFSDIRPQAEELSINSMQRGFEKIPFTRIFTVEKLQQMKYKLLI